MIDLETFTSQSAVYVHIPFCSAVCPYCDFAVVAGADDMIERYISALVLEIHASGPWRPLDAVYVGGGTPSHVGPSHLGSVLEALAAVHGVAPDAEISLEANPEDFEPDRARSLKSVGFNRVSFGAQSFDNEVLIALGRRHDGSQIDASVRAAREAGFDNISIDLIFGTPGETDESWARSLTRAVGANPDHLSCYALTTEPGTPFGRSVRDGAAGPDPDVQADRYEFAEEILNDAGMSRYEVSNWATPGHECRYNLTVWAQGEYMAYGNGANGHRGGVRFRNIRRLDAYLQAIEAKGSAQASSDRMSPWEYELDRLFVGLRTTAGVLVGRGGRALLASREGSRLFDLGLVEATDGRIRVTNPLLTDEVNRAILGLNDPVKPI